MGAKPVHRWGSHHLRRWRRERNNFGSDIAAARLSFGPQKPLIAHYPFDGSAEDVSGNGNHGTILGGAGFTSDHLGNPSPESARDARCGGSESRAAHRSRETD